MIHFITYVAIQIMCSIIFQRNATLGGSIRISTGLSDVKDLAKVVAFNGRKRLKFWRGLPCNTLKGTDGSLFHPHINKNETLHVFTAELCQSLPLVYKDEHALEGIHTYR